MFVKIDGERHYLWRAVDHEGEVLESFVTKKRDKKAALKFLKKSLRRHGSVDEFVTDCLCSYGAALGSLGIREHQKTGQWMTNRAENSHLPFRRRERAMLRFRRMRTLQKFASVHASVSNHFNKERCLSSRHLFKASPDLVTLTRKAAAGGASTVALLNTLDSPLGRIADKALPLATGPELAVAATKSFVASLVAVTAIHAGQTGNRALRDELVALPEVLRSKESEPKLDLRPLAHARRLFCIGRGLGLAIAGEAALKFKETCLLAAEAASLAEFRHGPLALADSDTAALVFLLDDATRQGTELLIETLHDRGASVIVSSAGSEVGPHALRHPATQAIVAIARIYETIHALAVSLGFNPDVPPHLGSGPIKSIAGSGFR
ncbi:MAG: DDE-type integrase/transposase/recombinase [Nitrospira sp.]|nr:DDE-type integrase/transposase/recombinase [Nitrospira sp.]